MEQLASYQYVIVHRPGKLHVNADALSIRPSGVSGRVFYGEEKAMKEVVPEAQSHIISVGVLEEEIWDIL